MSAKHNFNITLYHAKYLAFELTGKHPSGDPWKLAASLQDAKVDLNPHQVKAALFAFQSPLSKGAILAYEVGLGKTIEAGIILSQKWADYMKFSPEKEIKLRKAEVRKILDLKIKVLEQRQIKDLERKKNEKRRPLFESQDDIDAKKEKLLNNIENRLNQEVIESILFEIFWSVF